MDLHDRGLAGELDLGFISAWCANGYRILDLSGNNLTGISESSFNALGKLTHINLAGNPIKALPESLINLKNLRELDLLGCGFSEEELGCIRSELLKTTILADGDAPVSTSPTSIRVWGQRLGKLNCKFDAPLKIRNLELSYNELATFPSGIALLTELEGLRLDVNRLKSLPSGIGDLRKLKALDCSANLLPSISDEITELKELEELDLALNQIPKLPTSISELQKLRILDLCGNPLVEGELERIRNALPNTNVIQ